MNTKYLMGISAVVLGITGIILTFMPEEVSVFLNFTQSPSILLQILGALYFAFAMLNWTAKGNLIGGIYSRPVAIGNFAHFFIGGVALIKLVLHNPDFPYLWICAVLYLVFALLFGWVLFIHPKSSNKKVSNTFS
ncbi:MAG: hypothetical protein ABIR81_01105 [Ginsengibacter sp.]